MILTTGPQKPAQTIENPMSTICSQCDQPIPAGANCHYCLMELGKSATSVDERDQTILSPEQVAESFPQYEIVRVVGRGGMGVIYQARQKTLERDVALKVIASNVAEDPAFAERFEREAKTLAKLSHPNIVTVYDFGTTSDGLVYLAMEFVDGVNLREAIQTQAIESHEALEIVRETCSALQYAHAKGIVHRDIKPENVLINEEGVVKVADFGLAKLLGSTQQQFTLTQTRQVMGTLHYMAPEQMETPNQVDHRADIYSLGVMFYELLTGQLPIGRFENPSTLNPRLSNSIDRVVLRTLSRKPANRYQSIADLATELNRLTEEGMQSTGESIPILTPAAPSEQPNTLGVFSVPFSVEVAGSFAEAVGVLRMENDIVYISYKTRDKVFGVIQSKTQNVQIPVKELSKLECRPGIFRAKLTVTPQRLELSDDLPNASGGQCEIFIKQQDAPEAARMIRYAQQRFSHLRNANDSNNFVNALSTGTLDPTATNKRITIGVLFLVCACLNLIGMILALVTLADEADDPAIVFVIVMIPIIFGLTFAAQIVGGITSFSAFERRWPLIASVVSMIPLTPAFPLSVPLGIYAFRMLTQKTTQDRPQSQFMSTMMYLRKSKWSSTIAGGNLLLIAAIAGGLIIYRTGYYPQDTYYRVVRKDTVNAMLDAVDQRICQHIPSVIISSDRDRIRVRSMQYQVDEIQEMLKIATDVQLMWLVNNSNNEPSVKLAGAFANAKGINNSELRVANETRTITSSDFLTLIAVRDEISMVLTSESREWLESGRPEEVVALALMVDDMVEAIATPADISSREVRFTLAKDSPINARQLEYAIRGPALDSPLEAL